MRQKTIGDALDAAMSGVDIELRNNLDYLRDHGYSWDVQDGRLKIITKGHLGDADPRKAYKIFDSLQEIIEDERWWDKRHTLPKPIADYQIRDAIINRTRVTDKEDKKGNGSNSLRLIVGTLEKDGSFKWHDVHSYGKADEAYKAYVKYVAQQQKYSEEDLKRVWKTGRLDIELLDGRKLLNWTGIFSRLAMGLDDGEEQEAAKKKPAKKEDDKKDN